MSVGEIFLLDTILEEMEEESSEEEPGVTDQLAVPEHLYNEEMTLASNERAEGNDDELEAIANGLAPLTGARRQSTTSSSGPITKAVAELAKNGRPRPSDVTKRNLPSSEGSRFDVGTLVDSNDEVLESAATGRAGTTSAFTKTANTVELSTAAPVPRSVQRVQEAEGRQGATCRPHAADETDNEEKLQKTRCSVSSVRQRGARVKAQLGVGIVVEERTCESQTEGRQPVDRADSEAERCAPEDEDVAVVGRGASKSTSLVEWEDSPTNASVKRARKLFEELPGVVDDDVAETIGLPAGGQRGNGTLAEMMVEAKKELETEEAKLWTGERVQEWFRDYFMVIPPPALLYLFTEYANTKLAMQVTWVLSVMTAICAHYQYDEVPLTMRQAWDAVTRDHYHDPAAAGSDEPVRFSTRRERGEARARQKEELVREKLRAEQKVREEKVRAEEERVREKRAEADRVETKAKEKEREVEYERERLLRELFIIIIIIIIIIIAQWDTTTTIARRSLSATLPPTTPLCEAPL